VYQMSSLTSGQKSPDHEESTEHAAGFGSRRVLRRWLGRWRLPFPIAIRAVISWKGKALCGLGDQRFLDVGTLTQRSYGFGKHIAEPYADMRDWNIQILMTHHITEILQNDI
jgi:hypothetical protein